jgi:hypothetical protein
MTDDKLWELAQKQAAKEYEEKCGSWEDADKYEREDWVFSAYMKLKSKEEV